MHRRRTNPQPNLPDLDERETREVVSGSEQLDIASHELAGLETRLASEGRFVTLLVVRPAGYSVTIRKRRDCLLPAVQKSVASAA